MIPVFPNFKKVEFSDREEVESFTHNIQPYSDFNFISLWAWDVDNQRMISSLNDNLVVLFTDYKTNEPFLSFLGTKKPTRTAIDLLDYSTTNHISPILQLVGEETVRNISNKSLIVTSTRKDYDYIFSTTDLISMVGSKFGSKRNQLNKFRSHYSKAFLKSEILGTSIPKKHIFSILEKWSIQKRRERKDDSIQEKKAIEKILENKNNSRLMLSYLNIENKFIGFSIDEILPNNYAMSHFLKADYTFKGVYDYMNNEIAKQLHSLGVKYWNWEQDLDIEGLRVSKQGYNPIKYLKKYSISYKQ